MNWLFCMSILYRHVNTLHEQFAPRDGTSVCSCYEYVFCVLDELSESFFSFFLWLFASELSLDFSKVDLGLMSCCCFSWCTDWHIVSLPISEISTFRPMQYSVSDKVRPKCHCSHVGLVCTVFRSSYTLHTRIIFSAISPGKRCTENTWVDPTAHWDLSTLQRIIDVKLRLIYGHSLSFCFNIAFNVRLLLSLVSVMCREVKYLYHAVVRRSKKRTRNPAFRDFAFDNI